MRRIWPWLPAIAWAALIYSLSAQPRLVIDLELNTDKLAHFLAYAVLGRRATYVSVATLATLILLSF